MFDQSSYAFKSGRQHDNRERGETRTSACERKDPYQVLGVPRGATQTEIKTAYRRLAMKNHPDRVQGDEAKKQATAKFAEISAAYELLTTNGSVGASHPSFAAAGNAPSYPEPRSTSYPYSRAFGDGKFHHQRFVDSFSRDFDPFGFGTFGNFEFSDPFDLFRRTFGDATTDDSPFGLFAGGRSFTQNTPIVMNMAAFGGFPSMFGNVIPDGTTTFSSSSLAYSGANGTSGSSAGRMISTTTTIINGKAVTRREETVINPDGTRTTMIDLTDDDTTDYKIPSIRDDHNRELKKHGNRLKEPTKPSQNSKVKTANVSPSGPALAASSLGNKRTGHETFNTPSNSLEKESEKTSAPKHSRRYKLISKEKLHHAQSSVPPAPGNVLPKSRLSENETYVIDPRIEKQEENNMNAMKANSEHNRTEQVNNMRTTRKRKFCEVLYKCLLCCFPPCKRRRVTSDG